MNKKEKRVSGVSRRSFLVSMAKTLGTAGTFIYAGRSAVARGTGGAGSAADGRRLTDRLGDLTSKFKFKGKVFTPEQAEFNQVAFGGLWNRLRPKRHPQVIAQVGDDDDVIAAIKFARENGLKVTVRGGGHNWCNPSLRNNGMLIDLHNLNKVVSIDVEKNVAVVQPIVSNREVQKALNAHGLSYPSGHCPEVKLSGYLLSGGMSWNQGHWGPGVGSVEAIELVTAEGEFLTASASQNQDYFWAARGGGASFFGVVVRYHLKLYSLPKAITCSSYYYPYDNVEVVGKWLGELAPQLSEKVELSLFLLDAPEYLKSHCLNSSGKLCMVAATMFADSKEEAEAALAPLEHCPVRSKALNVSVNKPTVFEELFDVSGALWPADLRCKVDALFSNESPSSLFKAVQGHFKIVESKKTVVMFAIFTGKNVPVPLLSDAAFSMSAKLYGGVWTMWESGIDDHANIAWHEKCVKLLKPHICGHYVSETDTVGHPDYARDSFTQDNWKKLAQLRAKHDPTGLFFDFMGGLT